MNQEHDETTASVQAPMRRSDHKFGHREMVFTPAGVGTVTQFGENLTYYVTIPRDEDVVIGQYGQWFAESQLTALTDEQYEIHVRALAKIRERRP